MWKMDPWFSKGPLYRPPLPPEKSTPVKDHLKDTVRNKMVEVSDEFIDRAVDKFFYEMLPSVWHEHVVPFYHRTKRTVYFKGSKGGYSHYTEKNEYRSSDRSEKQVQR